MKMVWKIDEDGNGFFYSGCGGILFRVKASVDMNIKSKHGGAQILRTQICPSIRAVTSISSENVETILLV